MIKKVLNFVILLILFWFGLVFGETYYASNKVIKVGIEKNFGGAIKYIEYKNYGNIVDYYDKGRLVQIAIFGNSDYCSSENVNCCIYDIKANATRFNPTQGGANIYKDSKTCGSINRVASLFYKRDEIGRVWEVGAMTVPLNWNDGKILDNKVRMAMKVEIPNNTDPVFIIDSDIRFKNLETYEATNELLVQEIPTFYLSYSKFDKVYNGAGCENIPLKGDVIRDTDGYVILHSKNGYYFGFLTELVDTNLTTYVVSDNIWLHVFDGVKSSDNSGKTIDVKRIIYTPVLSNMKIHTITYVAFGNSINDVKNKINNTKSANMAEDLIRFYFPNTYDHYYNTNTQLRQYFLNINNNSVLVEGSLGKVYPECSYNNGKPLYEIYIPCWHDSFITDDEIEINNLIWNNYNAVAIGRFIGCSKNNGNIPIDRWFNSDILDHLLTIQGSIEENNLPSCGYKLEPNNPKFRLNN